MNINGIMALLLFALGLGFAISGNSIAILLFLLSMNSHAHYRIDLLVGAVEELVNGKK